MIALRATVLGFGAVAICIDAPAGACLPWPPPVRLPDESDEAYEVREQTSVAAQENDSLRQFQERMFLEADNVELAIVKSHEPIDIPNFFDDGARTVVRPIAAIKGKHDPADAILMSDVPTSCGVVGGGSAAAAKPGQYILLFRGLPGSSIKPYGLVLTDVRYLPLLRAIDKWAAEAERRRLNPGNDR